MISDKDKKKLNIFTGTQNWILDELKVKHTDGFP